MNDEETRVAERRTITKGATAVPETIEAVLKVIGGTDSGKSFEITKARTVIGRAMNADVSIGDESMSRNHAAIVFRNMEFRIEDLDSSNGTLLNGSEVKEYALRNGDKIIMGDTMFQFVFNRA